MSLSVCLLACLPACLYVGIFFVVNKDPQYNKMKVSMKYTTIKYKPLGRRRERLPINDCLVLISIMVPLEVNSKKY